MEVAVHIFFFPYFWVCVCVFWLLHDYYYFFKDVCVPKEIPLVPKVRNLAEVILKVLSLE